MTEVPVLKTRKRRGDVITKSDIEILRMRSDSIAHDVVLNMDELIGTTPRTSLNSGQPVRGFDLQMPKIVKRSDNITMVYNSGAIYIETLGRALQDGAKGDLIRVLNESSKRSVMAEVIGDRVVQVR
jgi:flagella basal body P-ring formation protein FlgA